MEGHEIKTAPFLTGIPCLYKGGNYGRHLRQRRYCPAEPALRQAERLCPHPLHRPGKEKIHRLHSVDPFRRVLLLSGPPPQKHPSMAPLLLFHRRNLVDRGPLPHVRHGEAEK